MKRLLFIVISMVVVLGTITSCLTHEQSVTKNAKKRYKNFQPADCGCKK
ncbi:MAG TPA: hypothetical protein PLS12_01115 [Bacteroidales bacterium]|nr:hypothetical protein [Bacteroidales bacterium]